LFVLATVVSAALVPRQAGEAAQGNPSTEGEYAKRILSDIRPMNIPPDVMAEIEDQKKQQSMVDSFYLPNLDETRMERAPCLDLHSLFKGTAKGYAEQ
jgi:hypothetical protein